MSDYHHLAAVELVIPADDWEAEKVPLLRGGEYRGRLQLLRGNQPPVEAVAYRQPHGRRWEVELATGEVLKFDYFNVVVRPEVPHD